MTTVAAIGAAWIGGNALAAAVWVGACEWCRRNRPATPADTLRASAVELLGAALAICDAA